MKGEGEVEGEAFPVTFENWINKKTALIFSIYGLYISHSKCSCESSSEKNIQNVYQSALNPWNLPYSEKLLDLRLKNGNKNMNKK